MIGPELQAAVYAALVAANVASGRVYDRVPASPMFPYVTIGDEQIIDDGANGDADGCAGGIEATIDVHAWSRPVEGSKAEVKTLNAAIVAVLKGLASVAGATIITRRLETVRTFRDADGLTEHGVVTYTYTLDAA